MIHCIGHNCKVLAGEGAAEVTCVGDEGLPCAGHRHFQLVLQQPAQIHWCPKSKPVRGAYGASAKTYLRKVAATKQEEMPEKERCQNWHGTSRGAKETPEQGRCWRKRRNKRRSIHSKAGAKERLEQGWGASRAGTALWGLWPRGGTSSDYLSKEQRAVKEKEKPHSDHLLLWCPLAHQGAEVWWAVRGLAMAGKESFYRGKWYFPPV